MSKSKKNFFAQSKNLDPKLHRAKYFFTLDEAKAWCIEQGGGTVKKRNGKTLYGGGYGLERIEFDPPLRVWGEVYDTDKDLNFQKQNEDK